MLDKEKYSEEIVSLKKKYPKVTVLIEATKEEVDWLKQKKGKEDGA